MPCLATILETFHSKYPILKILRGDMENNCDQLIFSQKVSFKKIFFCFYLIHFGLMDAITSRPAVNLQNSFNHFCFVLKVLYALSKKYEEK